MNTPPMHYNLYEFIHISLPEAIKNLQEKLTG